MSAGDQGTRLFESFVNRGKETEAVPGGARSIVDAVRVAPYGAGMSLRRRRVNGAELKSPEYMRTGGLPPIISSGT